MSAHYAKLTGREEVPPVKTHAKGKFRSHHNECLLKYKLTVEKIKKVTDAHIHLGRPGENGPIVVTLFRPCKPTGEVDGLLAKGKITAKDLRGPLKGKSLKHLHHEIKRGNAYVNVHTERYPNGLIRGQLKNKH